MLAQPDPPFEFVTAPHLLVWSEEELRHKAALSCAKLKRQERHLALRHVTIIGTRSIDFNSLHKDKDSVRLALALRYLMESGVPVSPDFVVDCVDFRDKRDFLEETGETDIVFASYIRGRPSTSSRHYTPAFEMDVAEDFGQSANLQSETEWAYYHAQSPLTEREGWKNRVENSGAKIFMAFGGDIEVGTGHVVGRDADSAFATIIANPDITDANVRRKQMTFPYIYPYAKDLDLPMMWLGIAMRKSYGRDVQRLIRQEPSTFMTRKMLTLFRQGYEPALKAPDVGLVSIWRNGGLLPALRTVLKLKGHDIGFNWAQRKKADAERNSRPQNGMYP